jgi:di/tricarboxylate transporter
MSPEMMLAVIAVPLIILRLAFSSIVALGALSVPTILGLLVSFNDPSISVWGVTLISSFLVYFSFLLPVNTPATLLTYATDTYELKDMLKLGIPLTILGVLVYILFTHTYWHWVGII